MDYEEPSNVLLPLVAIQSGVYAKAPTIDESTFTEIQKLAESDEISPFRILNAINSVSGSFPRLHQLLKSSEKTESFWQWAIIYYLFTGIRVFNVGVNHKPERVQMNFMQRAHARKVGHY